MPYIMRLMPRLALSVPRGGHRRPHVFGAGQVTRLCQCKAAGARLFDRCAANCGREWMAKTLTIRIKSADASLDEFRKSFKDLEVGRAVGRREGVYFTSIKGARNL